MRIMIVNAYYAPDIRGGAEYSVKKLAEGLTKKGHTVRVLCTSDSDIHENIDGVDVVRIRTAGLHFKGDIHDVPRWKRLMGHLMGIWNIGNYKLIVKEIRDFQPDVINTNNLYGISPIAWKAAKDNKVKLVHTIRDYHLMCPLVALSCKKTNGKKCSDPMASCKLHRNLNRFHSKYVDVVTAPSSITLNVLTGDGFFRKSQKVVIPNATDFDEENVKSVLNMKRNRNRDVISFVYLGTLSEQKGIRWMIDSFNELQKGSAKLYIAGKGDLQGYVEEETKKTNDIEFVGFLNEKGVSELLRKTDVLLCPSLWEEPFGRVVLDAYKNALPVICSNMGALPELVKDERTGFVVKARDKDMMVKKMNHYVMHPEDILIHAENGVEELQSYTIEHQIELFEKCYR